MTFDPGTLPKEVREAYEMGALAWPLAVQRALDKGETRADKLADLVFFMHYPERNGARIKGHETDLADAWMAFRELIRPIVRYRRAKDMPDGEGPLDGYVCSSFGSQAHERLKVAENRACASNPGKRMDKLLESDILFLSGHHYAGFNEPMHFDAIDLREYRIVAPRVRLIMVSSCRGLQRNSLMNFRKKFPNAYILGWLGPSPLNQRGLMRKFLGSIGEYVDISSSAGMDRVITAWKSFVENLPTGAGEVRVWGLGYATPGGKTEWWDGSKWHVRGR